MDKVEEAIRIQKLVDDDYRLREKMGRLTIPEKEFLWQGNHNEAIEITERENQ